MSVLCLHDRVGARSIAAVTDYSPSAYVCRSIDKCRMLLNVTTPFDAQCHEAYNSRQLTVFPLARVAFRSS
jgi:hypothetical protein